MFFAILVLIIALFTAGVAAWFSIVGLMAIFASAPIAIATMASALEAAKLVTASWLYRNWHDAPMMLRYPLATMTFVLMIITSLGIFGFLSKSHIEQGAPVGNNVAKIERLDQKITREQKEIDDATSVVLQLDNAVKVLQDYDRIRGDDGAIAVRKGQKEERADLRSIIDEAQSNIDKYEDERFKLQSTVRAFEVEVGPIKYVADMIYGDETGKSALESAVRWLIMIIIFVFDPLAVLLLIAANYSLIDQGLKVHPKKQKKQSLEDEMFDDLADRVDEEIEKADAIEIFESFGNIVDKSEEFNPDQVDESYKPEVRGPLFKAKAEMEFIPAKEEEIVEETDNENTESTDELAKTDDKVTDNKPRGLTGIKGWLLNDNNIQ